VLLTPRMLWGNDTGRWHCIRRTLMVRPFPRNSTCSQPETVAGLIRERSVSLREPSPSAPVGHCSVYRPSAAYSSLGSMFVAIAMRLVRLYIEAISATSHASCNVRPASSSASRSALHTSRGVSVSFSA
jgi:hypothetical protein